MSRKATVGSFNAYSGDLPEDFASGRGRGKRAGDDAAAAGKGRGAGARLLRWVTLLSVCALIAAAWQFREPATAWAGQYTAIEFEMPDLNMPSMEGPLLNRPIRSVRINTAVERITENEIRGLIAPHLGGGFFSLDVRALKEEIESHPWVQQVSIRRVWPDELSVDVYEQRPIARWGEQQVLNQHSEMFSPGDFAGQGRLPLLDGPDESADEVMRRYQQFTQLLQAVGLRIGALSLSENGEWDLVTDNGIRLNIGRDDVSGRVQRFALLYEQTLHEEASEIAAVDLRYSNGLAVRKGAPVR